ncbi:hypothetical protein BC829DRAFT_238474 [Chytridium lagenaria]|nr:hypothetical protein BC829DRAFT_238474 [Chytridium lagenaria]
MNLIRHGANAHLLIHEATFEDSLSSEAKARKHSTIAEALDVASQMKASSILLTHFSQRTPRIPKELLQKSQSNPDLNVVIAFDLMGFSLKELTRFPSYLKPLGSLFPSSGSLLDSNEGEEKKKTSGL